MKLERHTIPTPVNLAAIEYKRALGLRAESLDVMAAVTEEMVATVKVDGELNALYFDGKRAILGNNGKKTRTRCPPTIEVERLLPANRIKSALFMGELYAIGEDGGRIPLGEVQHIIQKPSEAEELRIRFAVFDVVEINDRPVEERYWKRLALVNDLFKDTFYCRPVIAAKVDGNLLVDMWNKQVLEKRLEGLVVRTGKRAVKIKVSTTQTVVVIGMTEGAGKVRGKAGALALAYMDGDRHFRYAGKVGTGMTMADRKSWWAFRGQYGCGSMSLRGDTVHLIKPAQVVDVASDAINVTEREVLSFGNGKYVLQAFRGACGVNSKPRYISRREGVEPTPKTVGLRQIPDFEDVVGEPLTKRFHNPQIIDLSEPSSNPLPLLVGRAMTSGVAQYAGGKGAEKAHGYLEGRGNPAYRGSTGIYLGPGDPVYGASRDTVLGAALLQGAQQAAASGAFMRARREVPMITEGNPAPIANKLICPLDGGDLVYYGRGNTDTEEGVIVYRCVECDRTYRKKPVGGVAET